MEKENFLEKLSSQFGHNATVNNVYGSPIQSGEKTIIPVAQVAYGLGGGYGQQRKKNNSHPAHSPEEALLYERDKGGEGAGGGGGMYAKPKGVYEITPTSTRFIPAGSTRLLWIGLGIGFLLRGWVQCRKAK